MSKCAPRVNSKEDDIIVLSSDSEGDEAEDEGCGEEDAIINGMDIDVTPLETEAEVRARRNVVSHDVEMKVEDTADASTHPDQTAEESILPDLEDDEAINVFSPASGAIPEKCPDTPPPIMIRNAEDILSSPVVSTTTPVKLGESSPAQVPLKAGSPLAADPAPIEINGRSVSEVAECSSSTESTEILRKPKAAEALEKLIQVLKVHISKSTDFEIVEKRLWRNYGRLPVIADAVCDAIDGCCNEIVVDNRKMWRSLRALFKYFKDCSCKPSGCAQLPIYCLSATQAQARKQKQIETLEKQLAKYEKLIEKMDQRDSDWDDEFNSPYLMRTRMINKYMKGYENLCKVAGCNFLTDRPTQKKINLKDASRFPEIDSEVEKMINQKDYRFNTPDFRDIYRIAEEAKIEHNLILSPTELHKIALELFQATIGKIKARRQKDSHLALKLPANDGFDSLPDPADDDEELARKLEENKLKRRKEIDVLKEFAAKQTEVGEVAVEVPDDGADDSASEANDEEDNSEDDLAEGINVDTDVEDEENDKPRKSKRKQGPMTCYKPEGNDEDDTSSSADSNSNTSEKQESKVEHLSKKPRIENVK